MKRFALEAKPRKVTGKKVKKLRREGLIPANVYGKDIKSQSLELPLADFQKVFEEAGETGVVDLKIGKDTIPVLIHSLQTDYRRTPLHADFFKVNLKEKVTAMIPVEIIGEAKAVTDQIGLLEEITKEIEVEALPTDLPENVPVNVEALSQIDQQIIVEDLKAPAGITITSDPSLVIVKIGDLISDEAKKQAEEEAAAAEAASAEGAEGEAPAEGEGQAEKGAEEKAEGETPSTEQQGENKPQE